MRGRVGARLRVWSSAKVRVSGRGEWSGSVAKVRIGDKDRVRAGDKVDDA